MILLVVGIIFIMCLIVVSRSMYSLFADTSVGRDGYAHFLFARDIRKAGHRIPVRPANSPIAGTYGYPYLMHWALSFVPEKYYPDVNRFFSPSMDLIFSLLIVSLHPLGFLTLEETLIALLIFLATPEFIRPDLSHGTGITARKPGLILTTISFLAFSLWLQSSSIVAISIAVLTGAFVHLTSKFGTQAYVFISLGFVLFVHPVGFILLVGSILTAIILSRGRYLTVARGHLNHVYDYAVTKQFQNPFTAPGEGLAAVFSISYPRDVFKVVYRSHLTRSLIVNPFVVVLGIVLLFPVVGDMQSIPKVFLVWAVAGFMTTIVISLPYLRFIGHAERYAEYTMLPSLAILAGMWTTDSQIFKGFIGALILYGIVIHPIFLWAYSNEFSNESDQYFDELLNFLQDREDCTIVVQPFWKAREIAWFTDHGVVDFLLHGGSTQQAINEKNKLIPHEYGFITDDVEWLKQKYNPDYIIFDKSKVDEISDSEGILTPPKNEPQFKNERYTVYPFATENEITDRIEYKEV